MTQINRTLASTKEGLAFDYDPSGNRIAKHVYNSGGIQSSTYYVHDPQGNILATYKFSDPGSPSYMLKERNIFGSSRLGMSADTLEMIGATPVCSLTTITRYLGLKQFELTNHLGNVLSVVSDKKLEHSSDGGVTTDFYQPEIQSANDYYPLGMLMIDRSFSSSNYRFGFNGKEKDDEVNGEGDQQDYGMRIYTSRLGRFLSIDPLNEKFPELTPYQFASNTPIQAIDLDGQEAFFVHGTLSTPGRWVSNPKTITTLMNITNNRVLDAGFKWNAPLLNRETNRTIAAHQLARYIITHRVKGEEITIIGHSHGGNVAIQAANIIFKLTGEKVNIITIATPAYNGNKDKENPKNGVGINDHIALWNELDVVSGGFAGDDNYTNSPKTENVEIDVDQYYKKTVTEYKNAGHGEQYEQTKEVVDGMGAHSFDADHPEAIQKAIDKGAVKKLKPVPPKN